jgi:hypothetical protein
MVEGYQEFAHKIHLYSDKGIGAGSLATLSQSDVDIGPESSKGFSFANT